MARRKETESVAESMALEQNIHFTGRLRTLGQRPSKMIEDESPAIRFSHWSRQCAQQEWPHGERTTGSDSMSQHTEHSKLLGYAWASARRGAVLFLPRHSCAAIEQNSCIHGHTFVKLKASTLGVRENAVRSGKSRLARRLESAAVCCSSTAALNEKSSRVPVMHRLHHGQSACSASSRASTQ
eukprot:6569281-Prymnesium_polylepis.2